MDNFDPPDPAVDAAANPAEVPPETANAIDNALAWSDQTANVPGGGLFPEIPPLVGADPAAQQMMQGVQDIFATDAGQGQDMSDQVLRQMNAALDSSADTELSGQLKSALENMTGGGSLDEAAPLPSTDWQNAGGAGPVDAGEVGAGPADAGVPVPGENQDLSAVDGFFGLGGGAVGGGPDVIEGEAAGGEMPGESTPWFGSGEAVPQDAGEDPANAAAPDDEDLND